MKWEIYEEIYSYEALNISKNIIKNGEIVKIKRDGEKNIIEINSNDSEIIFKELLNEALNQQCRIDISKKNFKVSQLIITKALVSALGEESLPDKTAKK